MVFFGLTVKKAVNMMYKWEYSLILAYWLITIMTKQNTIIGKWKEKIVPKKRENDWGKDNHNYIVDQQDWLYAIMQSTNSNVIFPVTFLCPTDIFIENKNVEWLDVWYLYLPIKKGKS